LWVPDVTHYYLLSLAPALAAIFLGRAVNRRLKGHRFLTYVHVGLIVIGTALLIQAVYRKPEAAQPADANSGPRSASASGPG
jgi:hypothetical protein